MTEEEKYWLSKRLYLQADAKERELRDDAKRAYMRITHGITDELRKRRIMMDIDAELQKRVEYARLVILEPILDPQMKARLNHLRFKEKLEKERAEEERKRAEEKRKKEEEERKRLAEEEKRLAPIREKEAAERAKKEKEEREKQERERRERREQELREARIRQEQAEREERDKTILTWLVILLIIGGLIALIIIFRKWILLGICIFIVIGIIASNG